MNRIIQLYTNLSQEDAASVIDYLNTQKITYQIDDSGKTIKVPKEKVYETRLSLAGKGIPSSGIVGYEIFDKNHNGYVRVYAETELQKSTGR